MKREEVIEEAAKRLLKDVNPKHGRPVSSQLASDIRLVAGAVFEKAHTPTDDERGDLIRAASAAFKARGGAPDWEEDAIARDLIIRWHLRGFEDGERFGRRAVVPEPRRRMPKRLVNQLRRASGALEEYEFEGVAGDAPGLMNSAADLIEREWGSRPEPQGEPSDAQVLVEAIEKAISKLHWFPNNGVAEDLRAALRAGGVR